MIRLYLLLAVALPACGCTSALTMATARHAVVDPPVSEILAIWQPGEGRDSDGLPTRGFAGRILFFSATSPAPVAVEGGVTIYLFDDQGTAAEQSRPLHKFHFEADAWETHRTESDVGTAYQIFVPYVRSGDHQAVCSLRVRYEPTSGPQTLSEAADVTLTGHEEPRVDSSREVIPASFREAVSNSAGTSQESRRDGTPLRVHTIPLGSRSRRPNTSR